MNQLEIKIVHIWLRDRAYCLKVKGSYKEVWKIRLTRDQESRGQ